MQRPRLLDYALDYLYPPSCQQCEQSTAGGRLLCPDCFAAASRVRAPFCKRCGECYDGVLEDSFVCAHCRDLDFAFQFAQAALRNTAKNHELIVNYKYGKQRYWSGELARFCAELLEREPRFASLAHPLMVPVPLHWRKQWQRGFNQAELLAQQIGKQTELPWMPLLKRVRHTQPQTRLSRSQRAQNLKGAFTARPVPEGFDSVILIDDVFTTGSTAHACAQALKKQSPQIENIVVLTALRG